MYKEIIDFARKNGLSPKKNRKRSTIAAYIKLDTNGEYKGISTLDKKERPSVLVPNFGSYAATSRQANAIIEKMGYIFNIDENKHGEKHKSFLADITSGSDQCGSLSAIYNFLSRYEQDGIFHKRILEDLQNEKLNSKDFISWMIDGERVENMESDWNDWLIKKLEEMDEKSGKNLTEEKIISSFTGEVQTSVPKSGGPSINNVNRDIKEVFGLGRACFVASAKEKAYQSYGFDQAKAFQVGMDDAESLVAGLEYLLNDDNFRNKDFKLIYFYDDTAENIIGESLKGLDKEDIRDLAESEPDIISRIFDAVQKGEFPYIPEELKNVHYYMCNFNVPSTGRYLMSNECHGTYGSLVSNLYKWYKDTSLYTGTTTESITNFRSVLLNCISEKKAKNKSEANGKVCEQLGLLHDIGKRTENFQEVLEGTKIKQDHAIVAAIYYFSHGICDDKWLKRRMAAIMAAHHCFLYTMETIKSDSGKHTGAGHKIISEFLESRMDNHYSRNTADSNKEISVKDQEEYKEIKDYVEKNHLLIPLVAADHFDIGKMSCNERMLYIRMLLLRNMVQKDAIS